MKGFVQGLFRLSDYSWDRVVLNTKAKLAFLENIYDMEATVLEYEV